MGNRSSSHVSQYSTDFPPYYIRAPPPSGGYTPHINRPSFAPPPFHQSMTSLHHPHGTDSGYMTSPTETERLKDSAWKKGQSRLSLNETLIFDGHPQPPLPLPPPTFPPHLNAQLFPMPAPSQKQLKKWHKKQKKLLKKMGSMPPPIIPPHFPHITTISPYSRAFSMDNLASPVLDGYADARNSEKKSWEKGRNRNSEHFGEILPEISVGIPKSTISSYYSDGFGVTNKRNNHLSNTSVNASEHSRMASSNTERSSSVQIQTPSPSRLKRTPELAYKRIATNRVSHNIHLASDSDDGNQATSIIKDDDLGRNNRKPLPSENHANQNQLNAYPIFNKTTIINASANNTTMKAETFAEKKSSDLRLAKEAATNNHFGSVEIEIDDEGHSIISEKITNEHYHTSKTNSSNESPIIERQIPIKITHEAKEILENNARIFSQKPVDHHYYQKKSNISGDNTQTVDSSNNDQPSTTTQECDPLKRNTDYGSTISSLTQSSNIKTEISDIDFSWVNDVENRLEKEIAFMKEDYTRNQMPVRYFGIDDYTDEKFDSLSPSSKPTTNTSFSRNIEVFGNENDSRKELSEIHSHVKSKAAMFDNEALKAERNRFVTSQQGLSRLRARSTPRNDSTIFIPQPDYLRFDPISINTTHQDDSLRYFGRSQPDIHRLDSEEQNYKQANSNRYKVSDSTSNHLPVHYRQNNQLSRISDVKNEVLQGSRTYQTTEYYRQNAVRRNSEKPWRASVAY